MKRALGIALLALSAIAAVWALISGFREQAKERSDRLEILAKAREAKADKALERSIDNQES